MYPESGGDRVTPRGQFESAGDLPSEDEKLLIFTCLICVELDLMG